MKKDKESSFHFIFPKKTLGTPRRRSQESRKRQSQDPRANPKHMVEDEGEQERERG